MKRCPICYQDFSSKLLFLAHVFAFHKEIKDGPAFTSGLPGRFESAEHDSRYQAEFRHPRIMKRLPR